MRTGWRKRTALQIIDGGVVDCHHASPCAGFNRHVADRHTAFHGQGTDGRASKFNRITGATGSADLADHGQHDILGGHPRWQGTINLHQHGFGFLGQQRLRRQHVLDFRSTNTVREAGKRTMGRGVRITADHSHARQGCTLLRPDHVDNTLALVIHAEIGQTISFGIVVQGFDLQPRDRVSNPVGTIGGRYIMVGNHQVGGIAPWLPIG